MKIRPVVLALAGLAIAAGAGWWWRAGAQAGIVAAALPAVPDLANASAALQTRVRAADARARHRLTARRGLEELARLYQANGFYAEAMRCDAGLEKLEPTEPRWFHYHATILGGFGEVGRAARLWRQVIRLAPDYVPARLRLGDCLLKTDQLDEATAAYDAVLRISPDNPYALLNLARIDMEKQHWEQARTRLESVVRQTHFTLGYDLIVTDYEKLGLHAQATAIRGAAKASGAYHDPPDPWLDELMDFCYDPYRLGVVAGVAAQSGRSARAIRLLKRAIALAPTDISSHFQLASLAEMQHDIPVARDEYQSCTLLDPSFADGWAHLSALQAQLGDQAAAARTLAEGLAHCPNSPGLHLMRARNLRGAGRTQEAIAEFQTSIRLRPNEPEAYTELGNLYIDQGEVDAGIREMRAALEADPGDPLALSVMAFQAISTHDQAGAQRWMIRVADQPRVPQEQRTRLLTAYREAFGQDWTPENPSR
jgi:tetratricopeptide (TPR) repeat protein